MELQRRISPAESAACRTGFEVLIESYDGRNDVYLGRTQYDALEIDGEVFVRGQGLPIGEVVRARITHSFEFDLAGRFSDVNLPNKITLARIFLVPVVMFFLLVRFNLGQFQFGQGDHRQRDHRRPDLHSGRRHDGWTDISPGNGSS